MARTCSSPLLQPVLEERDLFAFLVDETIPLEPKVCVGADLHTEIEAFLAAIRDQGLVVSPPVLWDDLNEGVEWLGRPEEVLTCYGIAFLVFVAQLGECMMHQGEGRVGGGLASKLLLEFFYPGEQLLRYSDSGAPRLESTAAFAAKFGWEARIELDRPLRDPARLWSL